MNILRKGALTVCYSLFSITLFGFGLLFSLRMVFGTAGPLERALDTSGLYNVMVADIISQNQPTSGLPLKDPGLQDAIQKAFPPTLIKQSMNSILDGTYAWLQGKTQAPTFRIDLSGAKANLADYVGQYLQQRFAALPACNLAALPSTTATPMDPYTMPCLPPAALFNQAAAIAQAKQTVLANTDLLKSTTLTADTLKNDNGKTLQQQLRAIPRAYHTVMLSIYATGLLALLLGIGAVLLQTDRRAGVRHVSINLLAVSITSAVAAVLSSFVLGRVADRLNQSSATDRLIQAKLITVMHLLADDVRIWWLGCGVVAAVLGVTLWVGLRYIPPGAATVDDPKTPNPAAGTGNHQGDT